jgi:hypothetical protein
MKKSSLQFNKENRFQFFGVNCQFYFLLKYGFKSVVRVHLGSHFLTPENFQEVWRSVSPFKILIGRFDSTFQGARIHNPEYCAYLSLDSAKAKAAFEAEKNNDKKTLGRLLGYPDCCVENFIEYNSKHDPDFMIRAFLSTAIRPSFYCNSIFNLESKISSSQAELLNCHPEIFRDSFYLFLIGHIPCSLDCKRSIKIGKKTLEILRKKIPSLAKEIEFVLKKPVLYFDYLNWVIFEGRIQGNQLLYTRILPYRSFFSAEKLNLIKAGDRLVVGDEQISVFKEEKPIAKIKKDAKYEGILINFK